MSTLVCFHAHPDDDSIATAGTMGKAKARGHRVVLVVATRGEHGEPVPGVLAEGEQLAVRRTAETWDAADVLGVDRVEFLGYIDSGMVDTPTSREPWAFCNAEVDRAAASLAVILTEENADVLTVNDDHNGDGHPDHVQVHRVGHRAAQLAGVEQVYESTINRTQLERFAAIAGNGRAAEQQEGGLPDLLADPQFGTSEDVITHLVDVTEWLDLKRSAMRTHRSQMADDHFLLAMPDAAFTQSMGTEWYISACSAGENTLAAELFRPFQ
ncbi:MAG: PIG-L family deacetylase [Acidimicrobiales bacterium]